MHISSPQKLSSTLTSPHATHKGLEKGLSKWSPTTSKKEPFSEFFRWEYHPVQNMPPCERLPQQSSRKNNVWSQIQWKEVSTSTKRDSAEKHAAFCNKVPPNYA